MHIRVIDWGEQAVLKAWWCWWGGKGWCDLSGSNSIQCHITAQLNHLQYWVDQVIMPLPVGPESITRWMWPLQTYRVTAMFHFHPDPTCGLVFVLRDGLKDRWDFYLTCFSVQTSLDLRPELVILNLYLEAVLNTILWKQWQSTEILFLSKNLT